MIDTIEEIKGIITPLLQKHSVKKAGIAFQSTKSGANPPPVVIDVIVDISDRLSLLDFVGVKQELEEALGKKINLLEYHTLKPAMRDRLLRAEVRII